MPCYIKTGYSRYVRNTRSVLRYLAVIVCFALGLLCKPTLVTLPFVLLLLDYWPLCRFKSNLANQRSNLSLFTYLIIEKIPLFVLSAVASVIAAEAEGEAIKPLEAITYYQKALAIKPDYLEAQNMLAWILATAPQASLRNGNKAVELAQQANQLTGGNNPTILCTLAAADAEAGQFGDAVQNAKKTMALEQAAGQSGLAEQINGELELYQAGVPFHQDNK